MLAKKQKTKGIALVLVTLIVIAAGCTNNKNSNLVRQQGAQQQQNQYLPNGTVNNRVQVAKQAADKLTQINGIKSANVLVTNRNAYVAAVVNTGHTELTRDLEGQIAQHVKATDPNIQNVYVSTNPEFVNRVNTYVADVGQGKPVAGFFEQFSEMVQRIFPNPR
ncbi:YhcN/YlaJ family sporulation lipoprotein [Paenibacillus sp. SI8]|uniref:YhcN/YlaJ family sporulation lipoprotein n=1 Tax=unclassified Paenibacillus TaxID=185978 RepID=UPI00346611DA